MALRTVPVIKYTMSSLAVEHPDSFFKSMKILVLLAQFFGLMPITGLSGSYHKSLKFKWAHWKMIYEACALGGMIFLFVCYVITSLRLGLSYFSSSYLIFFGTQILAGFFFVQIAREWPKMNEEFARMEFRFKKYGYPKKTKLKFQIVTAIYMQIACGDTSLPDFTANKSLLKNAVFSSYTPSINAVEFIMEKCVDLIKFAPCAKIENDYGSIAEAFFVNSFYYVFPLISYNPWKGLLVMYFYLLANFAWNYTDLFLSLISLSLSQRFKQINTVLFRTQGQEMPSFFWRAIREELQRIINFSEKH